MRRLLMPLAVALVVSACGATPAPTPGPAASPTSAPSRAPATAPAAGPAATTWPTEPSVAFEPSSEPVVVNWDEAPAFPAPVLVADREKTNGIGRAGCPNLYHDAQGALSQIRSDCVDDDLTFVEPTAVVGGRDLVLRAPEGWRLSSQVVADTEPYGPFWIVSARRLAATPSGSMAADEVKEDAWIELARGEGFRLPALDAVAPEARGDYLVSVEAQVGQADGPWRTEGLTFYYWVRVE